MLALYACVTHQHDAPTVLLAALICLMGVYATFALATYAFHSKQKPERLLWSAACMVSSAVSTWATHFIAMLAFHPGTASGFDPTLTALSFVVALAVIGSGIFRCISTRTTAGLVQGGALVGVGVSAMHYLGMAAYVVAGEKRWDWTTVTVSIGFSLAFAVAGALCAFDRRKLPRALAPLAMLLAICSLHFTGMSAVTIIPDPGRSLPAGTVQPGAFGLLVAGATILLSALAVVGAVLDRMSRRRRRVEKDRLGRLADMAMEGLAICADGVIVSANTSLAHLTGSKLGALQGRRCADLFADIDPHSLPLSQETEALLNVGHEQVPVRILRRELTMNGRSHEVFAVRDQRERMAHEARIRNLAYSDTLTGLANRTRFKEELEDMAVGAGVGHTFAVIIVDLDRFKHVNDSLGHLAGDALLARVAGRLSAAIGPHDVLARLGGDEFAILQPQIGDATRTRTTAANVVELVGRPFIIEGQIVNVGASVGVALAPADGMTAETLLRNADLALYKAKADGRGAFRMFEQELDARIQARRQLETRLRKATARQEFQLHYQPIVDARSNAVLGAEALIRWRDDDRGLVSPAEFIPVAEDAGLISVIGEWVLRTACAEAASWPSHMTIAVNLSPAQFRDAGLGETIRRALADTGLAPHRLELEVTEGVLISEETRTLELLTELRRVGVRISLDDFGTGYSSLSYLTRFPFDKIKIDRSFVTRLPHSEESAAIVRAIVTMSRCLGLTTTVEGVETAEQFAFVAENNCDQVQGFLFSRPVEPEVFRALLSAQPCLSEIAA